MKTIQKLGLSLIALVALILVTLNLNAQVAPSPSGGGGGSGSSSDISVIQSADLGRDLGLRLGHRGSIYYGSPSIDWDYVGTQTGTNVVGAYAEDVLAQLAKFQYNFRLKNPEDTITVWAYVNDDSGNSLFYGQAEFKAGEKPKIQMWQQTVPILKNVQSAEVIPLKEDGTSGQPINLGVSEQGQLLWQNYLSGAPNGLLAVKYTDGRLETYRLSKPVGQSPVPTEGMAGLSIEGHYIFMGDAPIIDIIAVWNKPTAYFESSYFDVNTGAEGSFKTFDVRGVVQLPDGSTLLERPSAMELTDENGNNPFQYKLSTTGPSLIWLSGGKHRVRSFGWDLFGKPNTLYAGPPDGSSVPIPVTSVIEEK